MGFPSQVSSFPVTIKATQFWCRYSEARRGRGDALRRVKKAADVAAGLKKSVGIRALFGEPEKLAWLGCLMPMPSDILRVYHGIRRHVIGSLYGPPKNLLSNRTFREACSGLPDNHSPLIGKSDFQSISRTSGGRPCFQHSPRFGDVVAPESGGSVKSPLTRHPDRDRRLVACCL